jgi:DNA repair protein RecN (Recombination protein N)
MRKSKPPDSGKIPRPMLTELNLRDFAVVSAAELTLESRLTVVSGETGAGKSLLVDALLCLTGTRADAGMVRHGAERAELSAQFGLDDCPQARAWLAENELDEDGGCQLRRVIRADGGSRAWINGRPATLAQLGELGALLVEIHGQHEHQALLERAHQLELLDAYGQHGAELAEVRRQAQRWNAAERALAELSRGGDPGERIAYLQHQHAELAREQLEPEAIEILLGGHRRQANAAALSAAYDGALSRLSGEDGKPLSRALGQLHGELSRQLDSEPRLSEVVALLESARIQADEAASLLQRLADELETDPAQYQELESRLTRLHELARKHRLPLPELASRRDALGVELEALRGAGERGAALGTERDSALSAWREAARMLGQARTAAAFRLTDAVGKLLQELGMSGSVFAVELQPRGEDSPSAGGAERCEFLVSANPGQPPRPLRKVASGGELARISLAIEVAALGMDAVPTMVFDEVDSGIGGAVAEVVGQKLRALGGERQVLCVTHLPQVAAQGHQHLQVSKAVAGGGTASAVARLDEKGRIEELARMLGGVEITRETRANARQMLQRAQSSP